MTSPSPTHAFTKSAITSSAARAARGNAGRFGEWRVRSLVRALLPTYQMGCNLRLPNPRSTGGYAEADIVLVGYNGVFVLEVKHLTGLVRAVPGEGCWSVQRPRPPGGVERLHVRDGAAQVDTLTECARACLREVGYEERVQGLVVFSHPKVRVELGEAAAPWVRLERLADFILGFPRISAGRSRAGRLLHQLAQQAAA